jgi:carboxyl-terminal processing protease
MKLIFLSIFPFLSSLSFSQALVSEPSKIVTFCKVWGFLKYHNPCVAKGIFDWDGEFIDKLGIIERLKTKDEINNFYFTWISNLGKLKTNVKRTPPSNAILSNYDLHWVRDSTVFTSAVTHLLLRTQNNTRAKNEYVKKPHFGLASASYVNEKPYKDSIYPSKALRLLTLARYWNIVNYFYPYKYLTDTKWQDAITEFVPRFIAAENRKSYHLTMLELFAKLNDSHTGFNPQLYEAKFKLPPFRSKIIDDKIIVLDAYNDSLCKKHDIRYGDVILAIDGKTVKSRIDYFSKYVSASNYASLCNKIGKQLLWANIEDSTVIMFERDGLTFEKIIPNYSDSLFFKGVQTLLIRQLSKPAVTTYKLFDKNVAYIDLQKIRSKREAKKALKGIRDTDAVILDIRNYPSSSIFRPITNFFCTSRKPFAKYAKQSIKYPGALNWVKTTYCGKNGSDKYRGKVAVLIDESTMSFAEHFTMALKTIPGVILVGSHTAGADGSNHPFMLPGNISTSFSNEAVYYPNGGETQRTGIIPDITVAPTIEGTRLRKDEALEKAIEVLSRK